MTNISKLLIASFFTASVSTAALAQSGALPDTDTDAGAGVGVEAQATTGVGADTGTDIETGVDTGVGAAAGTGTGAAVGTDTGVAGAQADAMNHGQVISSLRAAGDAEADVEALGAADNARIVTLSELRGSAADQAEALDEALADHEDRVDDFRSAIDDNESLRDALDARGYSADDVMAVTSDATGEVTLIVDG